MKRLDVFLVENGFAASRTKAQDLIERQCVEVDGKLAKASSALVDNPKIHILNNNIEKYVSRAGLKLEGAITETKLNVKGLKVLDIGQSTGGFTDCLLKMGAAHVTGVDVGHDQLSKELKNHPQVTAVEGVNARSLDLQKNFDLVVGDLSFISLTLVLPAAHKHLNSGGQLLFLVKPQFEVGPENLDKRGIVKDASLYQLVETKIKSEAVKLGFKVTKYFSSVIDGKDGNKEFFIYCQK